MEPIGYSSILARENRKIIASAKEGPPKDDASALKDAVKTYVARLGEQIPVVEPPEVTRDIVGHVGFEAPPAKRINAREIMQGIAPTPLKVTEETVREGEPERMVNNLALHFITELTPQTAGSRSEIEATIRALQEADEFIDRVNTQKETLEIPEIAGSPAIRVRHMQGMLHLITRGALGNYQLEHLAFGTKGDLETLIETYQRRLLGIFDIPKPEDKPTTDYLGYQILNPKIAREMQGDGNPNNLQIPILIAPKTYGYYGPDRYYRNDYPLSDIFHDQQTVIIVENTGKVATAVNISESRYFLKLGQ